MASLDREHGLEETLFATEKMMWNFITLTLLAE